MKNLLNKVILIIFMIFTFPIITNAASISLENEKKNNNEVTYDIVYKPGENKVDAVKLEITLSSTDGINNKITNAGEYCTNISNCTLITGIYQSDTVVGTITLTNTLEEAKEITINYKAKSNETELNSNENTVNLKAMPKTTTTTTTTKITTTRTKKTDTNLSDIRVSIGALDTIFKNDTTNYAVTGIKDTVSSITLTSECNNYCTMNIICPTGECSISNINKSNKEDGNNTIVAKVNLQTGANQVSIISTNELGDANKTYTLTIYRGEINLNSTYLSNITINNAKLNEPFDSENTEYTITVDKNISELDILPIAEDPEAKVIIKGNKDFKVGENIVTITVTSKNNEDVYVYTLKVTKENTSNEITTTQKVTTKPAEKKESHDSKDIILIVVISLIVIAIITVIFIVLFKKKKTKPNNNNKNNKNGGLPENNIEVFKNDELISSEEIDNIPVPKKKQDIDEALDDLMQTKRLELGDLDI